MYTPLDIENKKFAKQIMNGYSVEEVDDFLDQLTVDYEKMYKEATENKRRIEELEKYWMIESKKKTPKALEKLNEKDKDQIPKFEIYFEFSAKLWYIKPYQILALNRWENLWILWVKIKKDDIISSSNITNKAIDLFGEITVWREK